MKKNARAFGCYGLASLFGYSDGMDEIAAALMARGIETTCHVQGVFWPYSNVGNVADQAIAAARQGCKIILYGHSMGADAAVRVAVRLAGADVRVALLACFDPTPFGCPDVPANVEKALGWWQPKGLGGYQIRPSVALQKLIDDQRAWLSTRAVKSNHKKIDNDPALQGIVLDWAGRVTA